MVVKQMRTILEKLEHRQLGTRGESTALTLVLGRTCQLLYHLHVGHTPAQHKVQEQCSVRI